MSRLLNNVFLYREIGVTLYHYYIMKNWLVISKKVMAIL